MKFPKFSLFTGYQFPYWSTLPVIAMPIFLDLDIFKFLIFRLSIFSNLLFFLSKRNHFDHLETIDEWQDIYTNYKTVITDFVNANQELIESESE